MVPIIVADKKKIKNDRKDDKKESESNKKKEKNNDRSKFIIYFDWEFQELSNGTRILKNGWEAAEIFTIPR